jgi:hypothetical protein
VEVLRDMIRFAASTKRPISAALWSVVTSGDLCPMRSRRSSRLTPAARSLRPIVWRRSRTRTVRNPAGASMPNHSRYRCAARLRARRQPAERKLRRGARRRVVRLRRCRRPTPSEAQASTMLLTSSGACAQAEKPGRAATASCHRRLAVFSTGIPISNALVAKSIATAAVISAALKRSPATNATSRSLLSRSA